MSLDTQNKKCAFCGLYLSFSNFHKNKAKIDGYQNNCKECMKSYKKKIKNKIEEQPTLLKKQFFYIPNIYLVGYGRAQTYQVSCLLCSTPYFCMNDEKEYSDLFCDSCHENDFKISSENISNINYVGNVIGWLAKIESPKRKRSFKNYKKCYERDKYCCQYCGYNLKDAKKFLPLHIDHIKPWSSQSGNSLNNIVVACQECNLIASDKWFSTFYEKKEYILSKKKHY